MKYINRELKGQYLYIKKQLLFEIVVTVIMFAMAFGLYFIGYFTLKTNKSLWSIFAVLAMLPACKSLVGVIMLFRFKSLSEEEHNEYVKAAGSVSCLFENVITTTSKSYYVRAFAIENNNLIGYIDASNDDVKKLQEHIDSVLKAGGHKNATIKIYDNKEAFLKRLEQMRDKLSDNTRTSVEEAIFKTIKAVSL